MISEELFFQIQYYLHKYFYLVTFLQVVLISLPFLFFKTSNRLIKTTPLFIISFFSTVYFWKLYELFYEEGWDRQSLCGWIEIANGSEDLNVYTAQLQSNLSIESPVFSFGYHPILLKKFQFLCNFSIQNYNFLIISILFLASLYFIKFFKNIKSSTVIIIIIFSFNNLLWLLLSGQFFFLEFITLIIALIFLKHGKYELAIFFMFIFGIKNIYLLVFSLYLAIKYFAWRGLAGFAALLLSINLISYNFFQDFIKFWFSSNGYLFGDRGSRHSFLVENFGQNNQSLFILLKDLTNIFKVSVDPLFLLLILSVFSLFFVFKIYKKLELSSSKEIMDLMTFLCLILLNPQLKPYSFIFFSAVLLFLLEELNLTKVENFSVQILTFSSIIYLCIYEFLYINYDAINFLIELQYKLILTHNFYSSWILFIFLYMLVTKKKNAKT